MHKYLRAIGFSDFKKEDMEKIYDVILEDPTREDSALDSDGNEFVEISKEFGESFGITLRGTYLDDDMFEIEYYFPYLSGKTISTTEYVEIEKHAEKESYAGICDELKIGVTLIFYLQNVIDYLKVSNSLVTLQMEQGVVLSGLSTEGKILLPIQKAEDHAFALKNDSADRNHLMEAARDGDEEAIDSLTLEDIDTYSLLSRRITHEDILTIVESYFMPYGIESDQYSVLGEILDFSLMQNTVTKEKVYCLEILCNEVNFHVCINEKDLMGEPQVGRRFKGNIWLQGNIKYTGA